MTEKHPQPETNDAEASEMLATLKFTRIQRRTTAGGTWAIGTIAGHRFDALVFPEHAESESYELGDSRISKLSIQQIDGPVLVANFDRGWDVRPTTEIAKQIVDLLAAGLAEFVHDIEPQGRPFTLTAVDTIKAK